MVFHMKLFLETYIKGKSRGGGGGILGIFQIVPNNVVLLESERGRWSKLVLLIRTCLSETEE